MFSPLTLLFHSPSKPLSSGMRLFLSLNSIQDNNPKNQHISSVITKVIIYTSLYRTYQKRSRFLIRKRERPIINNPSGLKCCRFFLRRERLTNKDIIIVHILRIQILHSEFMIAFQLEGHIQICTLGISYGNFYPAHTIGDDKH